MDAPVIDLPPLTTPKSAAARRKVGAVDALLSVAESAAAIQTEAFDPAERGGGRRPPTRLPENTVAGISCAQLRALVERIERLEEDKRAISDDIKDVFAEAKAGGFDVKTIRQVVRLRRQDPASRDEQRETLQLYMSALGME
jgi:uncharacterized protein (UPF0335 family)